MTNINCHMLNIEQKKGNSLSAEKHMDILQACVMVPQPTPTYPLTSDCFYRTATNGRDRVDVNCEVYVFSLTQKATVSHEASGLQHSRPTGSSSQTKSEEEQVKYTAHMTSSSPSTELTDCMFRLEGSVVSLAQSSRCFIQEGPKSLLCLITLLIRKSRMTWSSV